MAGSFFKASFNLHGDRSVSVSRTRPVVLQYCCKKMSDTRRQVLAAGAAMLLAPLVMTGLARLFPVREKQDKAFPHDLDRRNVWINRIGIACCLGGFGVGIAAYQFLPSTSPWGVAAGFGYAVILPTAAIATICLVIGGVARFNEFVDFYEREYGVGRVGLIWIFTPLIVLGVVATPKLIAGIQAITQ
jgi:hypothetical protein